MTAMMRTTKTAMIAIVIILLVAILSFVSRVLLVHITMRGQLPTRHPPQRLVAPIRVALTLQQRAPRMLDRLSLPA